MNERCWVVRGDCRDVLRCLPDNYIHCCVTSPPYWGLRDYGVPPSAWGGDADCAHEWDGQSCTSCGAWHGCLGLEPDIDLYVDHLVAVFHEVRRVLRDDGTLWLNLGDSYFRSGCKGGSGTPTGRNNRGENYAGAVRSLKRGEKNLVGVPWRVAFALQDDGWILRSDIVWDKPNPLPESVTDRPTKSHEYLFLFAKSGRYYYDIDAIREPHTSLHAPPGNKSAFVKGRRGNERRPNASRAFHPAGRNRRSVWTIATHAYTGAHFAVFAPALVEPCVLAGTSAYGCCPSCGAGWKRVVKGSALEDYRVVGWRPTCACYDVYYRTDFPKAHSWRQIRQRTMTGDWWRRVRKRPGREEWPRQPALMLDPFGGSGTVGEVALALGRSALLIELKPDYCALAQRRIDKSR